MRICGVDLVGNDAVICLLFLDKQQFSLPECRVRKLTLPKDHSRGDLQYFEASFAKPRENSQVVQSVLSWRLSFSLFRR